MDERNNHFDFDFTPIGQAIKKAREARGITREQLSGIIGYAPRHIQSIENEGQYPSIELFIQLITMFDVSVDEYIFPNKEVKKSSARRRLDAQLNRLNDKELAVLVYPTLKQLVPYLYGSNGNRIGALGVNQELFVKAAFIITAGRGQKALPCLRVSRNRPACALIQLGN